MCTILMICKQCANSPYPLPFPFCWLLYEQAFTCLIVWRQLTDYKMLPPSYLACVTTYIKIHSRVLTFCSENRKDRGFIPNRLHLTSWSQYSSSHSHIMLSLYFILLSICFIYKNEMAVVTTVFLVTLLSDIYTVVESNKY